MQPTFTGSSRRPRNVNLSGQRNINPWATTSWSNSPSGAGAARTVAHAQAEREKRHREREELRATKDLQRIWRGRRDRQRVKSRYRDEFDALYHQSRPSAPRDRVRRGCPLLLSLFDPSYLDDQRRLDLFAQDLRDSGLALVDLEDFYSTSSDRLARLLTRALERRPPDSSQAILPLLIDSVKRRPGSIAPVLQNYYKLVARYFEESSHSSLSTEHQRLLAEAATAPLWTGSVESGPDVQAYQVFAYSFLTSSELLLLQQNPVLIAQLLDLQALSQSVTNAFDTKENTGAVSKDGSLWLLAHFIALNRAVPTTQGSKYIEALYLQLSLHAADIELRLASSRKARKPNQGKVAGVQDSGPLAPYINTQLDFLVNEDGISELLSRFTSSASSTSALSDDASLLAGYTLVLLRCFPHHRDEIKMRLFHGDVATTDSPGNTTIPSTKYLWMAASETAIFNNIANTRAETRASSVISLLRPDSLDDPEWRTILLFLELYNFLLRVTDDEDFLPSEVELKSEQSLATQRIRSSGLNLSEVKHLVDLLKNLTLPLYYNLSEIMPSTSRPGLGALMGVASRNTGVTEGAQMAPLTFAGIIGMDLLGLRDVTTTTMRSLYERDSRRPFLPKDYWLMTGKFDMDRFYSAVILEEQRKAEMDEDDDDDSSSDGDDFDPFHTFNGQRLSRAAQIEKHRQLRRLQREQMLAQAGPKLEVLRNMPFVIPFEVRLQIFRQFVVVDKSKRRGGHVDPDRWRLWVMSGEGAFSPSFSNNRDVLGRHTARVKRGEVFNDAFDQFYPLGEGLKEPIQITFVDKFDQPEAGIDGGGVTKEFLTSVTEEAFRPGIDGHNMFVVNDRNLLYPNPTAFEEAAEALQLQGLPEDHESYKHAMVLLSRRYEFLGRIVGKCMYEGILVDIAFASFFLLKWSSSGQSASTDHRANLNDLRDLDPDLHRGLINLKNYPGDAADLSIDFTITDRIPDPFGGFRTVTRPLRKDGENITVTNRDRPLYISYVANYRLNAQQQRQTRAFLRGLGSIISPSWLSMFNQSELQRLVGGDSSEIDIEDLRGNTQYSGLYAVGDDGIEHPTIQLFWRVMRGFSDAERRDVLKYVTSTPRAPLLGFSQLSPRFSIRDGGADEERLPSTSTCVNLLKLPQYSKEATLRSKLLYAVQSGAGFDLS